MANIPDKVNILNQVTPLEYLDNLSNKLGVNFYIKRDDMTNLALGGNKLRKLEYIIKQAQDNNVDTLITIGGVQSNHCRLTAAAAAKFGMKCIIVSVGEYPGEVSANLFLDRILGAEVIIKNDDGRQVGVQYDEVINNVLNECKEKGGNPLYIPLGGSDEYGFLGYYEAGQEIAKQTKEQGIKTGRVFAAVGSIGTYLGLYCGLKTIKTLLTCEGIAIMPFGENKEKIMIDYYKRVNDKFKLGLDIKLNDFIIYKDYIYGGYNVPSKEVRESIYLMAREEGILLDPCYTGKAFTGIIELIKNGTIKKNETIIFIHTGGAPGLYTKHHREEFEKELKDGITII